MNNKSSLWVKGLAVGMGVLFVACMLFAPTALATTYYVDIVNGDDDYDGLAQTVGGGHGPWAHLPDTDGASGSGWEVIQNGDTVYVKGGTTCNQEVKFSTTWYNGSAAFDSILIKSGHLMGTPWGAGRAVYDMQDDYTAGFWIWKGNGITVEGFEIKNIKAGGVGKGFDTKSGNSCVAIGGWSSPYMNYTTIRDCYLHDSTRSKDDQGHGIETCNTDYIIVEKNIIGPNIGCKGVEIITGCDNGIIRNNYLTDCMEHGIVVVGNHYDVYNNILRMVPPYNYDPFYSLKTYGNYIDIWNNLIFQTEMPSEPTAEDERAQGIGLFGSSSYHADYNRVFHNTVYQFANTPNGREWGTAMAIGSERGLSPAHNEVENNLFIKTKNMWGGIVLFLYKASTTNEIDFNDLYYDSTTEEIMEWGDNSTSTFYNAADLNSAALSNGNTADDNVQADPVFTGGTFPSGFDGSWYPNTSYFALTAGTPLAIRETDNALTGDGTHGYSSATDKFEEDILGNTRSNWSMGAYEY
ncbi:MAG: right-handed parallel beta-helix repeat-containing protein [Planctomycetota bacterium]